MPGNTDSELAQAFVRVPRRGMVGTRMRDELA